MIGEQWKTIMYSLFEIRKILSVSKPGGDKGVKILLAAYSENASNSILALVCDNGKFNIYFIWYILHLLIVLNSLANYLQNGSKVYKLINLWTIWLSEDSKYYLKKYLNQNWARLL